MRKNSGWSLGDKDTKFKTIQTTFEQRFSARLPAPKVEEIPETGEDTEDERLSKDFT